MKVIHTISIPTDSTQAWSRLDISPSGERMVISCMSADRLQVINLTTGQTQWLSTWQDYSATRPVWSPDGKWILDACERRFEIIIFDAENGAIVNRFNFLGAFLGDFHGPDIHQCIFSRCGERFLVSSCNGVSCHRVSDGEPLWFDVCTESCCSCMCPTVDGRIAYTSGESRVVVRDIETGQVELIIPEAVQDFGKIAISPNGDRVACGVVNGRVCIRSSVTGDIINEIETGFQHVDQLAWSQDDQYLACECWDDQGNQQSVVVWDRAFQSLVARFNHDDETSQLRFHPKDSNQLYCGTDVASIIVLEVGTQ
jgi:WD40 repeat protein